MEAYIDIAESDDVKTWDYAKRNKIMHGGAFLECLCPPSSADKDGSTKYKAEVERVTKFQEDVEKEVTKRTYTEEEANINVAVLAIRTALTNKGVAVITEKSVKQIAKKVAEALKTPAAPPEHATASQSDDGRNNAQGGEDGSKQKLASQSDDGRNNAKGGGDGNKNRKGKQGRKKNRSGR